MSFSRLSLRTRKAKLRSLCIIPLRRVILLLYTYSPIPIYSYLYIVNVLLCSFIGYV
jgi:hypothetical protein